MKRIIYLITIVASLLSPGLGVGRYYLFHFLAFCSLLLLVSTNFTRISFSNPRALVTLFSSFCVICVALTFNFMTSDFVILAQYFFSALAFCIPFFCGKWNLLSKQDFESLLMWFIWFVLFYCGFECLLNFHLPVSFHFLGYYKLSDRVMSDYLATKPTFFYTNSLDLSLIIHLLITYVLLQYRRKGVALVGLFVLFFMECSRAGIVALFCQILALSIYAIFICKKMRDIVFLFFVFIFVGVAVYHFSPSSMHRSKLASFVTIGQNSLFGRILGTYDSVVAENESSREEGSVAVRGKIDSSFSFRWSLSLYALKVFFSSPILGGGAGWTQRSTVGQYGKVVSIHNFMLEFLADFGVFGVLFALSFCIYVLREIEPPGVVVYASALFVLVSCISVSSLRYFIPFWGVVGIMSGMFSIRRGGEQLDSCFNIDTYL